MKIKRQFFLNVKSQKTEIKRFMPLNNLYCSKVTTTIYTFPSYTSLYNDIHSTLEYYTKPSIINSN